MNPNQIVSKIHNNSDKIYNISNSYLDFRVGDRVTYRGNLDPFVIGGILKEHTYRNLTARVLSSRMQYGFIYVTVEYADGGYAVVQSKDLINQSHLYRMKRGVV